MTSGEPQLNYKSPLAPKEIDVLFRELVIPTLEAKLK